MQSLVSVRGEGCFPQCLIPCEWPKVRVEKTDSRLGEQWEEDETERFQEEKGVQASPEQTQWFLLEQAPGLIVGLGKPQGAG